MKINKGHNIVIKLKEILLNAVYFRRILIVFFFFFDFNWVWMGFSVLLFFLIEGRILFFFSGKTQIKFTVVQCKPYIHAKRKHEL